MSNKTLKTSVLYLVVILFHSLSVKAQVSRPQTIYEEDSRSEVSHIPNNQLKSWIQRTVALVDNMDLIEERDGVRGRLRPLGDEYQLCRNERFLQQPSLSFCTGFFIEDEWIVTAKHCVKKLSCDQFRILRDYRIEKAPAFRFKNKEYLECSEILESSDEDVAFLHIEDPGYSLLPVNDQKDIDVSITLSEKSSKVQILGFPLGLPMKWAEGSVLKRKKGHIYAAVDSFEGNSGSPIFDSSQRLIGLLLGGEEDFESFKKSKGCQRSYICHQGDNCEGEEILSIERIRDEFQSLVNSF